MVTFKNNSGTATKIVEYAYDYQNRWVRKTLDTNGDGTRESSSVFVYDGPQITLQFDKTGTGDAAAADLSHRYLWGPVQDQLLAAEQYDGTPAHDDPATETGRVLWPLLDHLNTVRDVAEYVSGNTSLVKHLTYTSFGEITSDSAPSIAWFFYNTGKPFDTDTGLYDHLLRKYDPGTQVWLSEDPIGHAAGSNSYAYVGRDPVRNSDPSGLVKVQARMKFTWGVIRRDTRYSHAAADPSVWYITDRNWEPEWRLSIDFESTEVDHSRTDRLTFSGAPDVDISWYEYRSEQLFGSKEWIRSGNTDRAYHVTRHWKIKDWEVRGKRDGLAPERSGSRCVECYVLDGNLDRQFGVDPVPSGIVTLASFLAIGLDFVPSAEVAENLMSLAGVAAAHEAGAVKFRAAERIPYQAIICADGFRMIGVWNIADREVRGGPWPSHLDKFHTGGNITTNVPNRRTLSIGEETARNRPISFVAYDRSIDNFETHPPSFDYGD
jgi:RHS repeat-associated protein